VGAAIGALVGGRYSAEMALVVAAVAFLLQAAIILISPVFRLERQPDMAAAARTADQRGSEILGAPGTIAR
jgi:hypothetical protein